MAISEKYAEILEGAIACYLDEFVPFYDLSKMWFHQMACRLTNPVCLDLSFPQYSELKLSDAEDQLRVRRFYHYLFLFYFSTTGSFKNKV